MTKKSRVLLALLLVALSLALVACGSASSSSSAGAAVSGDADKPKAGGTLNFALTGDVSVLDPAFAYDFTTNPVVNEITEGLLKFDDQSHLASNLAESWESPDPKTYIYHIRQGVKFQDGSPLTADDVVFSLERIRDPKTASPLAWMYGSVDKIEKTDDKTVKVTLKQPDAQWRYTVATTAGHIISKAYYEAHKDNFGKPEVGLMGTGPFKFSSWTAGSEIVLEKNADYWDKTGGPYLDKVVFKIIPEGATRVTGLKTGQINATIGLPADLIPTVQKIDTVRINTCDSFSANWIAFNTQKKPLDDVNARKALLYIIDKKSIMDNIVKDSGSIAKTIPVGPRLWVFAKDKWEDFYNKVTDYNLDLAKAKEYLAKSSSPNGFSAKIYTDSDAFRLNTVLAIQESAKQIGINLEVVKVSDTELTNLQFSSDGKRDYDIILGNWGSDFPDPAGNVYALFHSSGVGKGGSNFSNYKNTEVDKLLDDQSGLSDDTKRSELMISALQKVADDGAFDVVDYPKQIFAAGKDVTGYKISPLWYWDSFAKNLGFK